MTMKLLAKRLTTLLLVLAIPFLANAQQKTISGKVTSEKDGSAISGASVVAKGSNKGTKTAADGTYSLSVPTATTAVVISSVNFATQIVLIDGSNNANAALVASENSGLTEVVVVGYGTARKKDLTGAVSTVKAKDFVQGVITTPDQLLQGKVAGLQITNNSGQPGAAATVRVRGFNSVRSGTGQPLYVLDGIPLDGRTARPGFTAPGLGSTPDINPLLFINPNDIASMEVLKDASAAAIYGSRGANGVILITTKKGTSGQPKLDFNYSVGISNQARQYKVASASEYIALLSKYAITSGNYGSSVDAQKETVRTAISHNVGLGMSGGTENNNYRLSLNFQDNQGVIKTSDLKKYIATFKGSAKFLESRKLNFDYYLSMSKTEETIVPIADNAGFTGSLMSGAIGWNPTQSLVNANGKYNQLGINGLVNPLALLAYYKDKASITNLFAYVAPSYKINKQLEYKMTVGVNNQIGVRRSVIDSTLQSQNVSGRGLAAYGNNELSTLLINHVISYNGNLTSKLSLSALAGYEYQKFNYKGSSISGQDFTSNLVGYDNILQNASQTSLVVSSFNDPSSELQSFFGRAVLNYADKYLFTGTVRTDGSNKFGSNKKYGTFPSFAAKWNVSNEDFLKENKTISNLAVRIGWGLTGSQEFPAGSAQDQYKFSSGGGIYQSNYGNPDLTWEKTQQTNLGVDFEVLKRVNVSVDYFNKNTTNVLFNLPLPLPGPATRFWKNLPINIVNSGIEYKVDANILQKANLTWNFGINGQFLKNELKNYTGGDVLTGVVSGPGLSGVTSQKLINGKPLGTFYLLQYAGLNSGGVSTFTDPSGVAQIAVNANTKYESGSAIPKASIGINNEVIYKKWAFVMSMYGAFGQKILNNTAIAVLPIAKLGTYNVDTRFISDGQFKNDDLVASTKYLEKGNYLKLSNVTVRYNAGNVSMFRGLTFFATGQNLLTFTKYKGGDPEVNTNKDNGGFSSIGLDYTPYPTVKTFLFGFNFSL